MKLICFFTNANHILSKSGIFMTALSSSLINSFVSMLTLYNELGLEFIFMIVKI